MQAKRSQQPDSKSDVSFSHQMLSSSAAHLLYDTFWGSGDVAAPLTVQVQSSQVWFLSMLTGP